MQRRSIRARSVFPWAPVSLDQGGRQTAYTASICAQYPGIIHVSDGNMHEVNILD